MIIFSYSCTFFFMGLVKGCFRTSKPFFNIVCVCVCRCACVCRCVYVYVRVLGEVVYRWCHSLPSNFFSSFGPHKSDVSCITFFRRYVTFMGKYVLPCTSTCQCIKPKMVVAYLNLTATNIHFYCKRHTKTRLVLLHCLMFHKTPMREKWECFKIVYNVFLSACCVVMNVSLWVLW